MKVSQAIEKLLDACTDLERFELLDPSEDTYDIERADLQGRVDQAGVDLDAAIDAKIAAAQA